MIEDNKAITLADLERMRKLLPPPLMLRMVPPTDLDWKLLEAALGKQRVVFNDKRGRWHSISAKTAARRMKREVISQMGKKK
jgi:hypothetical protein